MRIAALLAVWVTSVLVVSAQTPPSQASPLMATLKLLVLQGRDAVNDVKGRTLNIPVVEVRDLNDQPVEGAQVIFALPANGPGGSFPGDAITFTTRTNVQGQASAPLAANTLPGRFSIQVTATAGDRFGQISIPQTNGTVIPRTSDQGLRHSSKKKWLIVAVVVAAAAATGAVIWTTRSSQSSTPTITVTAGPPIFGGP